MQNPDWRAQRHRQGRRCEASRTAQQNSQSEARPRSPLGEPTPPEEPDCCSKTAIVDRAPLRRPPRRAQLRCCSAGYGAVSEKEPRPTVSIRAPGEILPFQLIVETVYFPFKARRAVPLGTRKLGFSPQDSAGGGLASPPHGLCPRALGKYFCFNSSLKQSISLLRRGARGRSARESWSWLGNMLRLRSRAGPPTKVERTPTKAPTGPRGELAMLRIAGA